MKIKIIDGKFEIPKDFRISKNKRRLIIKTPWMCSIYRLCKDNFRISIQTFFRGEKGDKPYVPEGMISFDGFLYEVEEIKE